MFSWLKQLRRPKDDLDLNYVTDRIIACSKPWKQRTSQDNNRINVDALCGYLEQKHKGKYAVFNLS